MLEFLAVTLGLGVVEEGIDIGVVLEAVAEFLFGELEV